MNLRYLLVDVDGVASFGSQPWDGIANLVGPEGPARVNLNPQLGLAGWVNDLGLLMPDTYPRNVVGSVLLASLGAAQQPYAGPVLVTGWDPHATWRGETEIRSLAGVQPEALILLSTNIRRILGLTPGTPTLAGPGILGGSNGPWAADVLTFAEHVRTAPIPMPTVVTDPDQVLALLRRMGGGR